MYNYPPPSPTHSCILTEHTARQLVQNFSQLKGRWPTSYHGPSRSSISLNKRKLDAQVEVAELRDERRELKKKNRSSEADVANLHWSSPLDSKRVMNLQAQLDALKEQATKREQVLNHTVARWQAELSDLKVELQTCKSEDATMARARLIIHDRLWMKPARTNAQDHGRRKQPTVRLVQLGRDLTREGAGGDGVSCNKVQQVMQNVAFLQQMWRSWAISPSSA